MNLRLRFGMLAVAISTGVVGALGVAYAANPDTSTVYGGSCYLLGKSYFDASGSSNSYGYSMSNCAAAALSSESVYACFLDSSYTWQCSQAFNQPGSAIVEIDWSLPAHSTKSDHRVSFSVSPYLLTTSTDAY